ncbi:MAG: pilus assembly protein PilM [Planctomycetota bacterium]
MPFGLSRSRPPVIGVDFGADRVKLVQVQPGDPHQLIGAAAAEMPLNSREAPADRLAFLAEALPQLLRKQPFKGRRAILSMPALHTIVQQLVVEIAPEASVDDQVADELQSRLGIDPHRTLVRHHEVPVPGRGNQREFVCLAAPRDAVMRYIDLARRCKLDIVGMYAEPQAILTAFDFMHRRAGDDQRAVAYIDIGAASTKVVVSHGTTMVFAKAVPIGGDQFVREHARKQECGFAEARQNRIAQANGQAAPAPAAAAVAEPEIKPARRSRLAALSPDPDLDDMPPLRHGSDAEMPERITRKQAPAGSGSEALDCLIDEITLCVRHHTNSFPDVPLERLVFLGGEAGCTPTCQAIAKAVRTAAQLGDPLGRVTRKPRQKPTPGLDLREPQPGWAVPLGLSLSEPNL